MIVAGALLTVTWVRTRPPATTALPRAPKVLIVGLTHAGMADLVGGRMPNLAALARRGAYAAVTARVGGRWAPSTLQAYLSLGAGSAVTVSATAATATGGAVAVAAPGALPGLVLPGADAARHGARAARAPSLPGAMGDALHAAGLRTAVVGTPARPGAPTLPVRSGTGPPGTGSPTGPSPSAPPAGTPAPAAAALMDRSGRVDAGAIEPASLLTPAPFAVSGWAANPVALRGAVERALAEADVVLVDPGDLDRALDAPARGSPSVVEAGRRAALARTDALVGDLFADSNPNRSRVLMVIVGVTPPGPERALTPLVVVGSDTVTGRLWSASTRRLGLVTLADVTSTVISSVGDRSGRPALRGRLEGQSLRVRRAPAARAEAGLGDLRRLDADARAQQRLARPFRTALLWAMALFVVLAAVSLSPWGRPRRSGALVRVWALALAATPLAAFLSPLVRGADSTVAGGLGLVLALDALLVVGALAFGRRWREPQAPGSSGTIGAAAPCALGLMAAATLSTLLVDVWVGGILSVSGALGTSLLTAARFRGIGNAELGVIAGSFWVGALVAFDASGASDRAGGAADPGRRRLALRATTVVAGTVLLTLATPWLGAKIGGVLTLGPAMVMALILLSGRPADLRSAGLGAVASVVILAAAAAADRLLPGGPRSHLGRTAAHLESLPTTVQRKLATALHVTASSPWTWGAAAAVVLLLLARLWAPSIWTGRAHRAVLLGAAVATAAVAELVNDSGILAAALTLAAVVPYVAIVGLELTDGAESAGRTEASSPRLPNLEPWTSDPVSPG